MSSADFAVGIGGENGQGIATTGDILARIFARRGLNLNAYNAYQSIIRGGHTFLTIRASDGPVRSMGDKIDVLIPLNQDTMDRHLRLLKAGRLRPFTTRTRSSPAHAAAGVQLCPMPMKELTAGNKLAGQHRRPGRHAPDARHRVRAARRRSSRANSRRKGDAVVAENVGIARAGYEYAGAAFQGVSLQGAQARPKPLRRHHRQPGHRDGRRRRRASSFTPPIP